MQIEIYGKDNCIYCENAKRLCATIKMEYTYYNISENIHLKEQLITRLGVTPRSVPQIFVDGNAVGGFTEFKKYVKG